MASTELSGDRGGVSAASWFYDPKIRGIVYQVLVFVGLVAFVWWITNNTIENLRQANIASGYDFLNGRAGFDIGQTPIEYTSDSTYGRAFIVGMINTVIVAFFGILTATIVGFLIGLGRLSHNWLIRKICMVYVEIFRNIPPLLVIFFWYFGVLSVLPQPRDSVDMPLGSFLNNRGIFLPKAVWGEGAWLIGLAIVVASAAIVLVRRWAWQRQMATGQQFPLFWTGLGLILGLPILVYLLAGMPVSLEYPVAGNFGPRGGMQVIPEFIALMIALSTYTAAFIAEIVRAGILAVNRGQSEASHALGLRPGPALRLVIIPQALRVIIPPLTSQYLNLTKNSSLAVAIAYPDLTAVFAGTALNQTGQAVEILLMTMLTYLAISLAVSLFMNWYNAKMALVER